MNKTKDYTLGIILACLPLVAYFLYAIQTPLYATLALVFVILSTVGYIFYIQKTAYVHLNALLIIPFVLWLVTLKDQFITQTSMSGIMIGLLAIGLMLLTLGCGLWKACRYRNC
ncbi:MAG: hypothetical protein RSD02_10965 [Niameybacter sp.]